MAEASRSVRLNQAQLDELLRSPRGTVGQHFQRVAAAATREAQALAKAELESRSGLYGRSFVSNVERGPRGLRIRTTNTAPHATFIEAGTRPHIIKPRNATVLAWKDRGGTSVFARLVNHPGNRPYRILQRAVEYAVRRFT